MSNTENNRVVTIGHSPDADDAFMFYGYACGAVQVEGVTVEHEIKDIQSLNGIAEKGDLDVTAISAAKYSELADRYRIMSCGASVGRKYGPIVVSKQAMDVADLKDAVVGCPGEATTSWLLYRIMTPGYKEVKFINFDELTTALMKDEVDVAILLHEKQITYMDEGLYKIIDLGSEWFRRFELPIPLGLDVINRKLPADLAQRVTNSFRDSIKYGLDNQREAVEYALRYGRDLSAEQAARFIGMYVNEDTLELKPDCRKALEVLYSEAHKKGLIDSIPELDVLYAN